MHHVSPNATAAAVPAEESDERALAPRARKGLSALQDETGAQVAEYAMLGAVSAAICAALVALFSKGEWIKILIEVVLDNLVSFISSWF